MIVVVWSVHLVFVELVVVWFVVVARLVVVVWFVVVAGLVVVVWFVVVGAGRCKDCHRQ